MARIQEALRDNGLDGLFCRVSEHVLYFTGYWPQNHVGAAVVPANGMPVLVLSELEAKWELGTYPPSSNVEVVTFPFESATELRGPNESMAVVLPSVFERLGLSGKVIGVEQSVEQSNVGIFQGEVKHPAQPTWDMLKTLFPKAGFKDATGVLMGLRAIKSEEEISAIKLAVEVAVMGFAAAREALRPGMKEVELASVIESAIHTRGTGHKGVRQARGYACVYTGPRSAKQWTHYARSTDRAIGQNDIVIMELGAFADGYWADLTRNFCAGKPPAKAQEMYEVALGAQRAAIEIAKPGTPIPQLDRAAREFMAKRGYAEYWPHGLGHGVGTAYHEGPPLHAANNQPLQAGMVLTIEPGIYIEGLAGIRPEDMIVVRETGAEVISGVFPHAL
ncbi:MAG: aminopeptidase P family protein [Chloroflexi bacterium]|nr:aminopeptidase P family protein [Chloroflexota bacterium]